MDNEHGWHSELQLKRRNSSVEFLRILSMLLIVQMHFFGKSIAINDLTSYETLSRTKLNFNLIWLQFSYFFGTGRLGVDIFFIISAWFLCGDFHGRRIDLHDSIARLWKMEQQVLFYSIGCFAVAASAGIGRGLGAFVRSLLPTLTYQYWYVSAFAAFLLCWPFITIGLHALGEHAHLILVAMLWGLFSFYPLLPGTNLLSGDIVVFFVLYPTIAWLRWYKQDWVAGADRTFVKVIGLVTLIGLVIAMLVTLQMITSHNGGGYRMKLMQRSHRSSRIVPRGRWLWQY